MENIQITALHWFIHRADDNGALLNSYVLYAILQPYSHRFDWTKALDVMGKVFELPPYYKWFVGVYDISWVIKSQLVRWIRTWKTENQLLQLKAKDQDYE